MNSYNYAALFNNNFCSTVFGMLLCNVELQGQVHSFNPAVIVFSMYHFKDIDT